jgi:SAM-dependent methyltransferase
MGGPESAGSVRYRADFDFRDDNVGCVSLAAAWEDHADEWIEWTRTSAHDGFLTGTWPALLAMLPEPGAGPVIDVGCGEGRAARELVGLGYRRIIGVERSPTLAAAAAAATQGVPVLIGDAAALPVADDSADLVLACMSLLDMDDFDGAVGEIGRVLRPGGRLCMAVVHPFASAQDVGTMHTGVFRVSEPYLEQRRYTDRVDRDGVAMTFTSMHRPLGVYTSALFANGMAITALTEGGNGTVPWLLALRADKLPR